MVKVQKRPERLRTTEDDRLAGALIQSLMIADPRYDLGVFGAFIHEIPRRIGANEALNSSVDCFATAFSFLRSGQSSLEMQQKYVTALSALRRTLDAPGQAASSNTLCAIFLLVVIQPWMGTYDGPLASHSKGVQNILKYASKSRDRSTFETDLLKAMCLQVIFESIFDPNLKVEDHTMALVRSWDIGKIGVPSQNETIGQEAESLSAIRSLTLRELAELSILIRNPVSNFAQIRSRYEQIQSDVYKIQARISKSVSLLAFQMGPHHSRPKACLKAHILHQTCYGLILTIALVVNAILLAVDNLSLALLAEALQLQNEVLTLAAEASQYRPMGASYMPLCLMVVWAGTSNAEVRNEAEKLLQDWQTDFPASNYLVGARWLRRTFQHLQSTLVWLWEGAV